MKEKKYFKKVSKEYGILPFVLKTFSLWATIFGYCSYASQSLIYAYAQRRTVIINLLYHRIAHFSCLRSLNLSLVITCVIWRLFPFPVIRIFREITVSWWYLFLFYQLVFFCHLEIMVSCVRWRSIFLRVMHATLVSKPLFWFFQSLKSFYIDSCQWGYFIHSKH